MIRHVYRALSLVSMAKAVSRGPAAVAKLLVRRKAHGTLSRAMRRRGL